MWEPRVQLDPLGSPGSLVITWRGVMLCRMGAAGLALVWGRFVPGVWSRSG